MDYMKSYWKALVDASKGPDSLYNVNKLLNPYSTSIRYNNSRVFDAYYAYVEDKKACVKSEGVEIIVKDIKIIKEKVKELCHDKQIYKLEVNNGLVVANNPLLKTVILGSFSFASIIAVMSPTPSKWKIPLFILPLINIALDSRDFEYSDCKCEPNIKRILAEARDIEYVAELWKKQ